MCGDTNEQRYDRSYGIVVPVRYDASRRAQLPVASPSPIGSNNRFSPRAAPPLTTIKRILIHTSLRPLPSLSVR
ncbi:unnamed protein product [Leptosia nina]|uniref:Uncharacterized protein n=1 Tax=Leptosia nina TaxID=320188 RepID=A0AAV1J9M2_9NEOP